jgi:DNA processing protein
VLKAEHKAVLAALNDDWRYRKGGACSQLTRLSGDRVDEAIGRCLVDMRAPTMLLRTDPVLELIARRGLGENSLDSYLRLMRAYAERDLRVITYWDDGYPHALRGIPDPPLILYVRGVEFPGSDRVAMVGTRAASERGLELAREFGRALAERGHTVVSGLASGIDTAAHEGALDAGGVTLAVLGGHVDHIYPRENDRLVSRIVQGGSVISEITPQAEISRGRFLERNRITSGLSEAVVVIETGRSGGTVRQAECARAQNRPVFIVDHGRFGSPESEEGFDRMVRSGATPVGSPSELRELLHR